MDKKHYDNTINLQIKDLFTLVDTQAENCFNKDKLNSLMDMGDFAKIKRVIISGCGDSFSAGGVVAPIMKQLAHLESAEASDPMEYSAFYDAEDTLAGRNADEVLVISISASGNSERIINILERANSHGVKTMLISNNPDSIGAQVARMLYNVDTPPGLNSPGLRSYFASMIALVSLGVHIGYAKGLISDDDYRDIAISLINYVKSYEPHFDAIDEQMFALGQTWKKFARVEIIGDEAELFSAQFVEEKFIECAGIQSAHVDTEDWCHINFFLRNPETVGTIFQLNSAAPSFGRAIESVKTAAGVGRPVLVVTDADASEFPEGVSVCQLPKPAEEFSWLLPIMDFVPGSMLAAYCAALEEKFFFAGRYDFRKQIFLT